MQFSSRLLIPSIALTFATAQAANIVLTNDDGWAEINIRTLFNSLTNDGHSVVLSAPAINESGTGSSEADPTTVGSGGCEFSSCPAGSPPYGSNSSQPRWNYVNSYPVTAMKYGVNTFAPSFFGGTPDIVVSGFNVGTNLGLAALFSGTVGAASAAADQLSIPGIAFSGDSGSQTAWNVSPVPDYALIYADLSANLTSTLLASGAPYLPSGTWLNVNFPAAGSGTSCTSASQFKFVLSKIYLSLGSDVKTCGNNGFLPTESTVVGTSGCYASVSVGVASNKLDADSTAQAAVLAKLGSILSCLPS